MLPFFLYITALVLGVLLFGAVHAYAYTTVFLCILTAGLIRLVQCVERRPGDGKYQVKIIKTPATLVFSLLLGYCVFQLIPLPQSLLKILSPHSLDVGLRLLPLYTSPTSHGIADKWIPIAAYGYPVRQSIVRLIVYWLMFTGLVAVLTSQKRMNLAIGVILGLGCFESLYGLAQTFSGAERIWWYAKDSYRGSVTGTYINYNHFAGLMETGLLLAAGFAVALARRDSHSSDLSAQYGKIAGNTVVGLLVRAVPRDARGQKRLLVIFCGVVMGLGLIFSKSRGGIIAVSTTVMVAAAVLMMKKESRKKAILPGVLVLLIAVYAALIGLDDPLKKFGSIETSFAERLRFSKTTLSIFKDYPLTGIGLGGFQYAYPRYKSGQDVHRIIHYAHNDWVQFLAEAGLVGFGLLVIGGAVYLYRTIRFRQRRTDIYGITLYNTFLAVFFCLAVHSLADFNLHLPANCLVLTTVAAIGYSGLYLRRGRRGDRMLYSYTVLPLRFKGGLVLAAITGLILWTGMTAGRHFMAEVYCHTVRNQTLSRDTAPGPAEIVKAIQWDGSNAAYWFKLADALEREKNEQSASISTMEGDQRLVVRSLENATRLNPFNGWHHVRLARAYLHVWQETGGYSQWLHRARGAIRNADVFSGPEPYLQCEIGNFWLILGAAATRSGAPDTAPEWATARRYYRKAVSLERPHKKGRLMRHIQTFIRSYYPDMEDVGEAFFIAPK